jgi:hypothetical protein
MGWQPSLRDRLPAMWSITTEGVSMNTPDLDKRHKIIENVG